MSLTDRVSQNVAIPVKTACAKRPKYPHHHYSPCHVCQDTHRLVELLDGAERGQATSAYEEYETQNCASCGTMLSMQPVLGV